MTRFYDHVMLRARIQLNVGGLEYPVPTKLIPLFDKNNPSIAINVLYPDTDSKGFHVLYRSPRRDCKHVNLLLLDNPENPSKNHYVWVKNMSALVCHRTKHRTHVAMCATLVCIPFRMSKP